jgi:predicted amidohydrolase YtcJ
VLDIFEELATARRRRRAPSHRARADHRPGDLPRLAQLGITASVQPIHATDDMDTADLFLGERTAHMYAFRSLLAAVRCWPLAATRRWRTPTLCRASRRAGAPAPVERLPGAGLVRRASASRWPGRLRYTLGAARAAGWDRKSAASRRASCADLIVLDRDLFALTTEEVQGRGVAEVLPWR